MSKFLSPLYTLNGNNIEEMVYNLKNDFYHLFLQKDSRPLFKGKFIFFNMNNKFLEAELPFAERFMHICSIEDKVNYTMFPCNNDNAFSICKNKCIFNKALTAFQKIGRTECPYRMRRIHWIPEIINMYNFNNDFITNWAKTTKNKKTNQLVNTEFVRYNDGQNDYVVILREDIDKRGNIKKYNFITAYPVFLKNNKTDFDKQYRKYQEEILINK